MRQTVLVCCSVVKMAGLLQALADAVFAPFAAQPAEELTPTTPTSKIKAEEVRFGHLSLASFMLLFVHVLCYSFCKQFVCCLYKLTYGT